MRIVRTALSAGAAAVLLSATCGAAVAKGPQSHVMTVRLPGGGVEEIRYSGDVAPQVTVSPEGIPVSVAWPLAMFDSDLSFAGLDRISAAMDRQMNVMLRNARA